MKNTLYIYSILLAIILTSCSSETDNNTNDENQAQTVETNHVQDNTEMQATVQQEYVLPSEFEYFQKAQDDYQIAYDAFYPIGWSKDGFFAYIELPDPGESDFFIFHIYVQNMKNDKNVWEWQFKTEDQNENIETVWKKNYDMIKKHLNDHHIIQQKQFSMGPTVFTHKGKNYSLSLKTSMEVNEDFGFDVITNSKLYIKSKELGSKLVYEFNESDYPTVVGQNIQGYFLSPYEDRIAIILKTNRFALEGMTDISFTLTGTSLTSGFKKDNSL